MEKEKVPVWEKFALTIQEAAQYFNIGEKKLRYLVQDHIDDGFVLQNGNKILIKREMFERFINTTSAI